MRVFRVRGWGGVLGAAILLGVPGGGALAQEPASVSLVEALRSSALRSEQVAIARAGLARASGERLRARSEYFPQVVASFGYTRTLASEFSAAVTTDTTGGAGGQPCAAFVPDPSLPIDVRLQRLEQALECSSNENPFGAFGDLPFGRAHQHNLGVTGQQLLFSGGRVQAQDRIARAGERAARIAYDQARAGLVMEVARAYWDATLGDRLLEIAESTLAQSERTLAFVRLAREVGDESEFEELRAQVARDTQEPAVIRRRTERDLAYLRLRQLLEIPLDQPIELTTDPETAGEVPTAALVAHVIGLAGDPEPEPAADSAAVERAPVRQAVEAVRAQDGLRAIARAQRWPTVTLTTAYGLVTYPASGLPTAWNQFRNNWTISLNATMPLFTGGRIKGDVRVAQAELDEAEERLALTRELAAVDTRAALEELAAAEATFAATASTEGQAARAYQIAEVRLVEGLSTQVELNDARILYEQATANRAVSARDLQLARLTVALIDFLPLGATVVPTAVPLPQVEPSNQPAPTRRAPSVSPSFIAAPGLR